MYQVSFKLSTSFVEDILVLICIRSEQVYFNKTWFQEDKIESRRERVSTTFTEEPSDVGGRIVKHEWRRILHVVVGDYCLWMVRLST